MSAVLVESRSYYSAGGIQSTYPSDHVTVWAVWATYREQEQEERARRLEEEFITISNGRGEMYRRM